MIEGLKIDVKSQELSLHLSDRAEFHAVKEHFYDEQVVKLQENDASMATAGKFSNDPVSSLRESAFRHKKKKKFFTFLAEHIVPDTTYRLEDHDLSRLELAE